MALGFQSDDKGFLTGKVLDTSRAILHAQEQSLDLWRGVRNEVRGIARALGVQAVRNSRSGSVSVPSAPRGLTTVQALGLAVKAATPAGRGGATATRANPAAARSPAAHAAQARAANGQFVKGAKAKGQSDTDAAAESRAWGGVTDKLGKAAGQLAAAASGMEQMDATLAASKEVAEVVAPLGRGLSTLFGRNAERKKERWYNRIWTALKGQKKGDTNTTLNAGASGGGGFLGTLLGSLLGGKGRGLMGRLLGGLLGRGAAGAATGAVGTAGARAGGGLLARVLGGAKGASGGAMRLLKRVPLLGALLTGGSALWSAFGGDDDARASPEENRARRYRNTGQAMGTGVGALVGGALGSFFGPAGTLGGAWLGSLIGEKVGGAIGDWTKSLIDSGVPEKVVAFASAAWDSLMSDLKSAWDTVTSTVQPLWTGAVEKVSTAWEGITKTVKDVMSTVSTVADAANDWVKQKTGFDVLGAAKSAVNSVVEARDKVRGAVADAAGKAREGTKAAASWAGNRIVDNAVPDTVKRAVSAGSSAASAIGSAVKSGSIWKGSEARALETGRAYSQGNIGGLDDANTRALVASTVQTESGGGKLDVVNSLGFMGRYQAGAGWLADAGLIKGGSAAVREAMKADGYSRESKWAAAGGMTRFLKDERNWTGGMSYDKYLASAETQDKAFKTNSDAAYNALVKSGAINSKTSQAEVAGLLKARHIAGMGGALAVARGGDSAADANGTTAAKYYGDLAYRGAKLTAAYSSTTAVPPPPGMPSASASAIPALPSADPVPERLSNSGSERPVSVQVRADANQDVRDRRIAQIVSGGIATGG